VVEPVRPGGEARLRLDRPQAPITRWGYKAQAPRSATWVRWRRTSALPFGLGEDRRHIDTIDSEGVALAAIQGLYRQNQALQRQNRSLNARLSRLEREVTKLSR
jgi:hypothetical protein